MLRKHLHDNLYFITFSSERKTIKYNDTTKLKVENHQKRPLQLCTRDDNNNNQLTSKSSDVFEDCELQKI